MLGEVVREYREAIGMKQAALAREIGTKPSYISELERGKRHPKLAVIRKLATALRVPEDELIRATKEDAGATLPQSNVPPTLTAVVQRVGQYLNDNDWERIVGYIEGKAEERRTTPNTIGYGKRKTEESAQEKSD